METFGEIVVKSLLQTILKKNLKSFSVCIEKKSKGDGFVGDIFYVRITHGNRQEANPCHLVLKLSKQSTALRKTFPVYEMFFNEIYFYNTLVPIFNKFLSEKGINQPMDNLPKFYGKSEYNNSEVLVLEDLKKRGYLMWDRKKPLPRKYLQAIIQELSKLHAISIAMKQQKPKQFENLCKPIMDNAYMKVVQVVGGAVLGDCITDLYELLKGHLNENILMIWKKLKQEFYDILLEISTDVTGFKVIIHGDSWINNFMFKINSEEDPLCIKVMVLDWQLFRYSSPVIDLSYLIFTSISNEDLQDLQIFLEYYYQNLEAFAGRLGSSVSTVYSFKQFLCDWKKYAKFGLIRAPFALKCCFTDREQVGDLGEAADKGQPLISANAFKATDEEGMRERAKYFVKYVVENGYLN